MRSLIPFALALVATVGCAARSPGHPSSGVTMTLPATDASGTMRPEPDAPIDAALRTQVIDGVLEKLPATYVFPDVATRMVAAVRARVQRHEYDGVRSSVMLAHLLTEHLREISHDKHLRVRYSASPVPPDRDPAKPTDLAKRERETRFARGVNYGIERVERLEGNIGYLEMRRFFEPSLAGETAAAAMTSLADTDALIIDLRQNGGGEPAMVAFVATYLFDAEPVHLNDIYFRRDDRIREFWTLPLIPAKRFGSKKPVYILTSTRTFSSAEEFTYDLKALKRAVIIGETTRGGANPCDEHRVTEHFSVFIPDGRPINPITKTNWEGTGVKPDVETSAENALSTAHILAIRQRIAQADDHESDAHLRQILDELQTKFGRRE
ncbi:S41 family peptidase [Pendulispora brunnea]|uniref:S41 family peptidase n=1 Tax=Pendulispora brunnea TaxID=2905690 RepID=A0ABZ2K1F9_9BACT